MIIAVIVMFGLYMLSKFISTLVARSIMKTATISDPEYVKKVSLLISNVVFYTLMVFSVVLAFKAVGIDLTIILG